jgi:hypothetical protein
MGDLHITTRGLLVATFYLALFFIACTLPLDGAGNNVAMAVMVLRCTTFFAGLTAIYGRAGAGLVFGGPVALLWITASVLFAIAK